MSEKVFKTVPEFPFLEISIDGTLRNKESKFEYLPTIIAGYYRYSFRGHDGTLVYRSMHRLLMLTFRNIDDAHLLHVNHKDGNRLNNYLDPDGNTENDNLEWVTQKENNQHARIMNMRKRSIAAYGKPIQVRDVDTGVVTRYPSMTEAARDLGVNIDFIHHRVYRGKQRAFPERKQYRKDYGDEPWRIPTKYELATLTDTGSKGVIARSTITKEIHLFESLTEFANHIGVKLPTASTYVNDKNQPVVNGCYQVKWVTDETPWREVEDSILELEKTTNKRAIVVIPENDVPLLYLSAVDCAEEMGISTTLLNYRLKSDGMTKFPDGKRYIYYSVYKERVRLYGDVWTRFIELRGRPMLPSAKAETETLDVREARRIAREAGFKNEELTTTKVRGPQAKGNPQPIA